ncbi:MAG: hypothetical protein LBK99_10985 [Opitutaceae bacterium]|jgi:hypothetical protein|nr:hypothetical protein [Opitutaceae bacterium]
MKTMILKNTKYPANAVTCTFALVIALSLALSAARAEIIVSETFDYPAGTPLAGAAGGAGTWSGAWIVHEAIPSAAVTSEGLRIGDGTANPSAAPGKNVIAAKRQFNRYRGDTIFVKYVFTAGPGTTTDADRFGVALPSNKHGCLLLGSGLGGTGSEETDNRIAARIHDSGPNRITIPDTFVGPGVTYTVVAEWSKSTPGPKEPYNRLRLWLNPKAEEVAPAPYRDLRHPELRSEINWAGFYIADTEPGDVYTVKSITIATTPEDVIN